MKIAAIATAFLFAISAAFAADVAKPSSDMDVGAFANGALIESASSDYGGGWRAIQMLDENASTGWATEKGAKGPFEIVIALPERSEIHAVEFDTASADGEGRSAKNVDVYISDQSVGAGYALLDSVSLKQADNQRFDVAKPLAGRWLKLVIKSNNGDADYAEIMNFRAFGTQLTHTPLPNVSGTYSSPQYGDFHLAQDGAQLSGCYEHDFGLVQGGLEGRLMRLTWTQGEKGETHGPAVMVLKPDGKTFHGMWSNDGSASWDGDWDLKKISDKVGSCPHWNPKGASGNVVATSLANEGRVRLYGINFDSDKDTLRADAKPTVDELVQALKTNPGWHITIEGHTDSTSTAAHNLDLSKRRADAVKAALIAGGIAADRLSAQGFGQTKPVASNDTDLGRAQNRRVEIVKQ
ncbi:MAG TPA: OmpA family protein [Rhizomicrobium sp.]|jgi:outer membrane protein OmpA-like peptidoglycan-associated protein|nr:OmpA family protein [Rhizomicrobium sp.]